MTYLLLLEKKQLALSLAEVLMLFLSIKLISLEGQAETTKKIRLGLPVSGSRFETVISRM
jgi:hypothetical protein